MSDLTHLQRIRQEMPATTDSVYLNTGTFGPLPKCVIQAIQNYLERELREGRLGKGFENISAAYSDARASIARLLHASENEIALTDNTGEGLNIISYGFDWHKGDEVITTNHEHISALAPLYQIRDRYGIVIRTADLGPAADRPVVEAIGELITPRTRLISLSHVTWTTGAVLDIQAVGRLGHEKGIPVVIDGAQSAGAVPINVKELEVDFYAIPMQKWLCGPDGTGALYTSQDALRNVASTYVGYYSIKHEVDAEWALNDTAQRFELGGRQTAAVAGQAAALHWLEDFVGHDWLFTRISTLNTYAYNALKDLPGLQMLTPQPGASGIIAFLLEGRDDSEVVKQLSQQHNIYIRNIPSTKALRVSTGFYNTEEEIDRLAQALRAL
ncbi:aminotransferase class V-fold PLP-dependent enzyme [Ktedonosporobacter rubrisoli]|uniref:aminotransferase class V-fold PLP-dependent enzyme n=1 Tax=Ktedonosporobacter rubrisoli TaxID=2509675 RepID=UPI0013EECC2F|nr:aminotransferase class V-fold PLP-dependent enzyme [Ktedonosporobacter rubrisoli]